MTKDKRSAYIMYISILGTILAISLFFIFAISNKNKTEKDSKNSDKSLLQSTEHAVNREENSESISDLFSNKEVSRSRTSNISSRAGGNMIAATIAPGEDFLLKPTNESVDDVHKQIDQIIQKVVSGGFNTLIVDLRYSDSVIYETEFFNSVMESDFMDYIEEKAKENNLYVYAKYELFSINDGGVIKDVPVLNPDATKKINDGLRSFISERALDGIILTSYNNPGGKNSFRDYSANGLSIGYDNYLNEMTLWSVGKAIDIIYDENKGLDVGIVVDSVWATSETDENGINASSDYEQFVDGHADTKRIIEKGYADFVIVDSASSSADVPIRELIDWWSGITKPVEVPLMLLYDEKNAEEVAEVELSPGYSGTVLASFQNFMEQNFDNDLSDDEDTDMDSEESKDPETVKIPIERAPEKAQQSEKPKEPDNSKEIQDIMSMIDEIPVSNELKITNLDSMVFTTEEPVVIIKGVSDPRQKLHVNDEEIETDENGYFAYEAVLKPGKNTFNFKHKDVTIVVVITQNVKLLKEVSPVGDVAVEGETKLTVTALSYEDADVTASLGDVQIKLKKSDEIDDDSDRESQFVRFVGEIAIPAAKSSEQSLGVIEFTASRSTQTESAKGANITVNKKVESSTTKGKLIQVTATLAETFPPDVINDVSNSAYYPLPKGTIDHVVSDVITYTQGGKTLEYYNLASGNRVYTKDVAILDTDIPGANSVSGVSITNDGTYTYVSIANDWKVSYKMTMSGKSVNISMMDTASVPSSMPSLTSNPLFSSAVWSDKTLQLKMSADGIFGVTPYYNNNTLVFQFANPKPSSSNNTVVVIDAGHGLKDPGAPGFYPGLDERELNILVAAKLKANLEAQGITAILVPDSAKSSLQKRIDFAVSSGADLFVSVHHNTSPNTKANGVEAYYFSNQSKSLASSVAAGISNSAGMTNRGGKYSTYFVTRHQHFPSILVECGFLSNQTEYNRLIESSTQEQIAKGLSDGIIAYLNNSYISAPIGIERSEVALPDAPTSETSSSQASSSQVSSSIPSDRIFDETSSSISWFSDDEEDEPEIHSSDAPPNDYSDGGWINTPFYWE